MDPARFATVYLALGANLGDREWALRQAVKYLGERGIEVTTVSSFIETEAVGGPSGQPPYLNGAACVRTQLDPRALLEVLLEVETELGRVRHAGERNAPRTIDLDILFYGDRIIEEVGLCVPHPRLHQRAFVLKPLAQIAPDLIHPTKGKSIAALLADLDACAR